MVKAAFTPDTFSNRPWAGNPSQTPVFIVGSELRGLGLRPWDLVAGRVDDLSIPGAVAIDQSYFDRLGTSGLGATSEIRDQKVQVTAVTKGIRSFTTTPFAFTGIDRARAFTGISPDKASYFLVRVTPGSDVEDVRRRLQTNLSDVEILTTTEGGPHTGPKAFAANGQRVIIARMGVGGAVGGNSGD